MDKRLRNHCFLCGQEIDNTNSNSWLSAKLKLGQENSIKLCHILELPHLGKQIEVQQVEKLIYCTQCTNRISGGKYLLNELEKLEKRIVELKSLFESQLKRNSALSDSLNFNIGIMAIGSNENNHKELSKISSQQFRIEILKELESSSISKTHGEIGNELFPKNGSVMKNLMIPKCPVTVKSEPNFDTYVHSLHLIQHESQCDDSSVYYQASSSSYNERQCDSKGIEVHAEDDEDEGNYNPNVDPFEGITSEDTYEVETAHEFENNDNRDFSIEEVPVPVVDVDLKPIIKIIRTRATREDRSRISDQGTVNKTQLILNCEFCEKTFNSRAGLVTHERTHTGEKPFECLECGKRFSQYGHLQTHKRTHTGVKPFNCRYCDKGFSQKTNLMAHERIHTGEKPYGCQYCGRKFTLMTNVKKHELSHVKTSSF